MFGWFSLREAIGMQSRGFQPKGDRADYHDRAPIRGLITLGYKHHLGKHLTLPAWNFHLDRLTNMTWLQADAQYKHFFGGLQYVQERASSYQKRLPYDQRYYQPGEVGQVLSFQGGYRLGKVRLSGAYLRAFGSGRFLYPRELGREDFYASQPRSWIDGFGNTSVYLLRASYERKVADKAILKADWRLSYTATPGAGETECNKYRIPSFFQSTARLRYQPKGFLEGLECMILYIYKRSPGQPTLAPEDIYYRTNLHHLNLVTNINF